MRQLRAENFGRMLQQGTLKIHYGFLHTDNSSFNNPKYANLNVLIVGGVISGKVVHTRLRGWVANYEGVLTTENADHIAALLTHLNATRKDGVL